MNHGTKHVIASLALAIASAPALASRRCSDYLNGINKALAISLSNASKGPLKDLGIGSKGEVLVGSPEDDFQGYGRAAITTVPPYTLPESMSKKLSYRFTDVSTKGVRNASGRPSISP